MSELGYKTAGIFPDPGLKVFNEYNNDNDKQFGMNWGDFYFYSTTAKKVIQIISDKIARHGILLGASHFNLLLNND